MVFLIPSVEIFNRMMSCQRFIVRQWPGSLSSPVFADCFSALNIDKKTTCVIRLVGMGWVQQRTVKDQWWCGEYIANKG